MKTHTKRTLALLVLTACTLSPSQGGPFKQRKNSFNKLKGQIETAETELFTAMKNFVKGVQNLASPPFFIPPCCAGIDLEGGVYTRTKFNTKGKKVTKPDFKLADEFLKGRQRDLKKYYLPLEYSEKYGMHPLSRHTQSPRGFYFTWRTAHR